MKTILYNPTLRELTDKINATAGLTGDISNGSIRFEVRADSAIGRGADMFAADGFYLTVRTDNRVLDRVKLADFTMGMPGYMYPVRVKYCLNTRLLSPHDGKSMRDFRLANCSGFLTDIDGVASIVATFPADLDAILTFLSDLDATSVLFSEMLTRLDPRKD